MFSRMELNELMSAEIPVGVSLYLPTHVKGRDVRQDPIRLKNLVDTALERLVDFGLRRTEAEEILAPAEELIPKEEFWRHQDHGLALFLAPGFSRVHQLPTEVEELALVGHRFHVKPLLPLFAADGQFFILTLTAKQARLYHGTKYRLAEVDFPLIPQRASEAVGSAGRPPEPQADIAARPQSGIPAGAIQPATEAEGPGEMWNTQLTGYLSQLENAVQESLAGETAPVVLVAEPEMDGQFRRITGIRNILEQGIHHNPEAMSPEQLHEQAYAIVKPLFEQGMHQAVDHVKSLLGTANPKGSTKPSEIVKGATDSRVDSLLLANGASLWGRVTEQGEITAAHAERSKDDEDLTDFAAVKTLQQGGKVYHIAPEEMPPGTVMAAVFRW